MTGKIHPRDEMTSRQRLLAAYRREEVDRLPFWAKVANDTWRLSQPEDIRRMSEADLLDYIGADGLFGLGRPARVTARRVTVENRAANGSRTTVTHTPDGDLTERWRQDPLTASWHPVEFPVKSRQDLKRFAWTYRDVEVAADEHALLRQRQAVERMGQRGIARTGWGTSPLMHLVEHVIGPVNTHLFLADWLEDMADLVETMHQVNLRVVREIARLTAADAVISVENTSTTLLSPKQFGKYCLRHLRDYGQAIEAEGRMHELHMCGHLEALLDDIDTIPAACIEAFTSPTLGNTRLADGRRRAPSKALVGGTNCCVWLRPLEEIREYILEELAPCPDHRGIVLTTAGVAPPACRAETFRRIGQWIPSLPVRM